MSTEIGTLLVSSPDVCGGRPCIQGTEITVNEIVVLYKQDFSAADIAHQYSQLTMAQVYAALAYYHANQEEIETELATEGTKTRAQANIENSLEKDIRWEAFKALQRSLSLTPAKAAEWQNTIHEARR